MFLRCRKDVHRRDRPVPDRPELEDPGRSGRTGDPLYGGDRPAWDCRCVYAVPSGDRAGRPRKSGTPVLSGTFDCGNPVRRLAALQLFSDGSDRVCVHSGNGSADEVEKNYGLFSGWMCIPVITDIEDQDCRQPGTLHVLTVFPTFILPDFYFTIPIKKWYTAVGGKRYLHAAVSFFRGK